MGIKGKLSAYFCSKNIAYIGLVLIFFLLMAQSGFTLFFDNENVSSEIQQIDIVFRTSLSSIFGYIISILAISKMSSSGNSSKTDAITQIGFTDTDTENNRYTMLNSENESLSKPLQVGSASKNDKNIGANVQTIALICICLFCLVVMMLVRNFSQYISATSSASVTVAMYRDFISSGIGALIGISKSGK